MSEAPEKLGSLLSPRSEPPRPPFFMIGLFLVLVVASWIPLVVFARARVSKTSDTRIHLVLDMADQPKLKTQQASHVFADGRELRLPIPGTVARGDLEKDDHYYRGYRRGSDGKPVFFDTLPAQVKLNEALLARGQERFNIYCSVCHGLDGSGNGPVNQRAVERQEPKWVPPADLHSELVLSRPYGHLFNTVTNGIRNMPGYGAQIPTADRWAIVAYLRALQLSQHAPASVVPADKIDSMR